MLSEALKQLSLDLEQSYYINYENMRITITELKLSKNNTLSIRQFLDKNKSK